MSEHVAFAAHGSLPPAHVPLSHQPSSAKPNSSDTVPSAVSASRAEVSTSVHVVFSAFFHGRKTPANVAFGEEEATHATSSPAADAVTFSPHCAVRRRLDMTTAGTVHPVELVWLHPPRRNRPVRDETP
jgi:hypothetical protein